MKNPRAKILQRIRKLREMTADRGCTEAEALEAAAKVADLMMRYGLSERDIELDEQTSRVKGTGRTIRSKLWQIIAYATNTALIIRSGHGIHVATFIGCPPGPEVAGYLRDVCDRAIDREVRGFKKTRFYRRRRTLSTKRQAVADFTDELILRLGSRILELFSPAQSDELRERAQHALAERFPGSTAVKRPERSTRFSEAAFHGWRAGERVHLSRGLAEGSERPAGLLGADS